MPHDIGGTCAGEYVIAIVLVHEVEPHGMVPGMLVLRSGFVHWQGSLPKERNERDKNKKKRSSTTEKRIPF